MAKILDFDHCFIVKDQLSAAVLKGTKISVYFSGQNNGLDLVCDTEDKACEMYSKMKNSIMNDD